MKVVQIQKVVPEKREEQILTDDRKPKNNWFFSKCQCGWKNEKPGECNCKIIYETENCDANINPTCQHSFFGAFLNAYNNHRDVTISPDDVWMMVCLNFTKYVNSLGVSEALRDKLVRHEGKKTLTVTTWNDLSEMQWEEFFQLMIIQLKENTASGIVDILKCSFSTTCIVEELISCATIMDTMKTYFDYTRCIPCCGIRAVRFMGTLDDWVNLKQKLQNLRTFDVDGQWSIFVDKISTHINKFIDTYQNNLSEAEMMDYWNKIMNITHGRLGSGSTSYITGWILDFYGLDPSQKHETDELTLKGVDVPVTIVNYRTGKTKKVDILGGFSGINYKDQSYRPQMSLAVFHDGNETEN